MESTRGSSNKWIKDFEPKSISSRCFTNVCMPVLNISSKRKLLLTTQMSKTNFEVHMKQLKVLVK